MSIIKQSIFEHELEIQINEIFKVQDFREDLEYDLDFNIEWALGSCQDYNLYRKELRTKTLWLSMFDYFDSLNLIKIED